MLIQTIQTGCSFHVFQIFNHNTFDNKTERINGDFLFIMKILND